MEFELASWSIESFSVSKTGTGTIPQAWLVYYND
jgi:hypothetical protein